MWFDSRPAKRQRSLGLLVLTTVLVTVLAIVPSTTVVSASDVSSTNIAIQSAFTSAYQAERNGGNITSLVATLNTALQLVAKAQAESAANPAQASDDLQAARLLASSVAAQSAAVSAAGSSLRQFNFVKSLVAAAAILIAASLIYVTGGRVFRWFWIRLYGGYVARPANE